MGITSNESRTIDGSTEIFRSILSHEVCYETILFITFTSVTESPGVNPVVPESQIVETHPLPAKLTASRAEDKTLLIELAGTWQVGHRIPSIRGVFDQIPDSVHTSLTGLRTWLLLQEITG